MREEFQQIWDSIKYDIDLRKDINYSKLERQLEIFQLCIQQGMRSYIEACTRFGKTMIAIIAIKRLNLKDESKKTIVIVPKLHLLNDWIKEDGHINTFNLKNVEVYVVNSYVLSDNQWECDLLVLDEAHRYANEDSEYFSTTLNKTNYKYVICLSATLDINKRKFLESYGIKRAGLVTLTEAERKGWISKHYIYNLELELGEEELDKYNEIQDIYSSTFSKFEHNWNYARGCSMANNSTYFDRDENVRRTGSEWRTWLAQRNNWNPSLGNDHDWSPKSISKFAQQWNWAVNQRQLFLHNHPLKIKATQDIILHLNKPTIIFSESTQFADEISLLLEGDVQSYHSKIPTKIYKDSTFKKMVAIGVKKDGKSMFKMLKSGSILTYKEVKAIFSKAKRLSGDKLKLKIIEDFNNGNLLGVSTVKALNEGLDSDRAEVGIIASGTSKSLDNTQRSGRILNQVDGKTAIIVNLVIKGTQDMKWLKRRQHKIPEGKIRTIKNINEIGI